MNTPKIPLIALTLACLLITTAARAWDFSYSYHTVNDAGALTYVVGQQNIARYNDWTGSSYWGPTVNDQQATLTSRFTFSGPTAEIFLHARIQAYNWYTPGGRIDYGFASLWGSTDGSSWQLLLDAPVPANLSMSDLVYNQDVPASLLGSNQFWLQTRLQQHGAMLFNPGDAAAWTDAQFSRFDGPGVTPPSTGDAFTLNAMLVPEPTLCGLLAVSLLWALHRRKSPCERALLNERLPRPLQQVP